MLLDRAQSKQVLEARQRIFSAGRSRTAIIVCGLPALGFGCLATQGQSERMHVIARMPQGGEPCARGGPHASALRRHQLRKTVFHIYQTKRVQDVWSGEQATSLYFEKVSIFSVSG